ncbi:Ger(x)C family spore germination protein [Tigheibacillus jepli]
MTYLIANPEYGSQQQGGSTDEPPVEIISFEANDLSTARNLANTVVAKEISYDLLRAILVSEDLAKDSRFVRWMYDGVKDPNIRRDIRFIVTNEPVVDFFEKNKPRLEVRPHKYYELLLKRGEETATIPKGYLNQYYRITEAGGDLFLGIYSSTERKNKPPKPGQPENNIIAGDFSYTGKTNSVIFAGSAVFKNGVMIDKLTAEETRLATSINNTMKAADILTTMPDPLNKRYNVSLRIRSNKNTHVKMDLHKAIPEIHITVPMLIDVLSTHSMINYATSTSNQKKLKEGLEKYLEKKYDNLVKKTQKQYKAEPFGWSLEARKKFLTIPAYEAYNWPKKYPDMKVHVNVEITFGGFGRQSRIPKVKEMR